VAGSSSFLRRFSGIPPLPLGFWHFVALVVGDLVVVFSGVVAGAPFPQPLLQLRPQAGEVVQ
jgi:hypothetical protein